MRVAVISDTHLPRGGRVLPPRCLELCRTADAILHAGDFTSVGAYGDIDALGPRLRAVHGNVDESALTHMPEHEHADGFQIFNPGSPTERRRSPAHTMGMAHVQDGHIAFEIVELT